MSTNDVSYARNLRGMLEEERKSVEQIDQNAVKIVQHVCGQNKHGDIFTMNNIILCNILFAFFSHKDIDT